ncbi:terpene cyclase/mutase family protein, partial [Rhizobium jaguaris]
LGVRGLGPALHFAADADDTAVVLCVLRLAGRDPAVDALRQFETGGLFVTFPGERNASVSTNIHALHALRLLGKRAAGTSAYVEATRNPHGLWDNEKWHVSWLYPTAHALAALAQGKQQWRDERALAALLQAQRDDGGWGAGRASTFEETAYALFALHVMDGREEPIGRARIAQVVARALEWMLARHAAHRLPQTPLWIGKELYCPTRVVRVAELAGLWLALSWGRRAAEEAGAAP